MAVRAGASRRSGSRPSYLDMRRERRTSMRSQDGEKLPGHSPASDREAQHVAGRDAEGDDVSVWDRQQRAQLATARRRYIDEVTNWEEGAGELPRPPSLGRPSLHENLASHLALPGDEHVNHISATAFTPAPAGSESVEHGKSFPASAEAAARQYPESVAWMPFADDGLSHQVDIMDFTVAESEVVQAAVESGAAPRSITKRLSDQSYSSRQDVASNMGFYFHTDSVKGQQEAMMSPGMPPSAIAQWSQAGLKLAQSMGDSKDARILTMLVMASWREQKLRKQLKKARRHAESLAAAAAELQEQLVEALERADAKAQEAEGRSTRKRSDYSSDRDSRGESTSRRRRRRESSPENSPSRRRQSSGRGRREDSDEDEEEDSEEELKAQAEAAASVAKRQKSIREAEKAAAHVRLLEDQAAKMRAELESQKAAADREREEHQRQMKEQQEQERAQREKERAEREQLQAELLGDMDKKQRAIQRERERERQRREQAEREREEHERQQREREKEQKASEEMKVMEKRLQEMEQRGALAAQQAAAAAAAAAVQMQAASAQEAPRRSRRGTAIAAQTAVEMGTMKAELAARDETISEMRETLAELRAELRTEVAAREATISTLRADVGQARAELMAKEGISSELRDRIEGLKEEVAAEKSNNRVLKVHLEESRERVGNRFEDEQRFSHSLEARWEKTNEEMARLWRQLEESWTKLEEERTWRGTLGDYALQLENKIAVLDDYALELERRVETGKTALKQQRERTVAQWWALSTLLHCFASWRELWTVLRCFCKWREIWKSKDDFHVRVQRFLRIYDKTLIFLAKEKFFRLLKKQHVEVVREVKEQVVVNKFKPVAVRQVVIPPEQLSMNVFNAYARHVMEQMMNKRAERRAAELLNAVSEQFPEVADFLQAEAEHDEEPAEEHEDEDVEAEEEEKRRQQEEEEERRHLEEEEERLREEEDKLREDAERLRQEDEERRLQEEEEERLRHEEELERLREEEEQHLREEEEERLAWEQEEQRLREEEEERLRLEEEIRLREGIEERRRLKEEEEDRLREEQEERRRLQEEEQRLIEQELQEQKRLEEEHAALEEEERQLQEEELRVQTEREQNEEDMEEEESDDAKELPTSEPSSEESESSEDGQSVEPKPPKKAPRDKVKKMHIANMAQKELQERRQAMVDRMRIKQERAQVLEEKRRAAEEKKRMLEEKRLARAEELQRLQEEKEAAKEKKRRELEEKRKAREEERQKQLEEKKKQKEERKQARDDKRRAHREKREQKQQELEERLKREEEEKQRRAAALEEHRRQAAELEARKREHCKRSTALSAISVEEVPSELSSPRSVAAASEASSAVPSELSEDGMAALSSERSSSLSASTASGPTDLEPAATARASEELVMSKAKASRKSSLTVLDQKSKSKMSPKEREKMVTKAKTKPKSKAKPKAKEKRKTKVEAVHDSRLEKLKAAAEARRAREEEEQRRQEEEKKVTEMRHEMEKAAAVQILEMEKREFDMRQKAMENEVEMERMRKFLLKQNVRHVLANQFDKATIRKFFHAFIEFFNWNAFVKGVAYFYERRHGRILFALCLRAWRTVTEEKKKEHGRFAEARYTAARALKQRELKGDLELGVRKRQVMDHFTLKVVLTRWHGLVVDARGPNAVVAEKKDPLKSQSTRWAHWAADVTSPAQLRDLAVPVQSLPSLSELYRGKAVDPAPPPLPPQAGWEEIAGPLPGSHGQVLRVVSDGEKTQFFSEVGSDRRGPDYAIPSALSFLDSAVSAGAAAYGRNLLQMPGLSPRPGMVVRSPAEGGFGGGGGGNTPGAYSKSGGYPRFGN